ncbi:MAG: hypothetical protein D6768_15125 [Chloroflexi bacterium]|nr:MAG: hypothetical protein D6768_15125 [Chloroflexota bacterium]
MIVFVDIELARVKKTDPARWRRHLSDVLAAKYRLEALSGQPCLVVHYEKVTPVLLRQLQADAVLVSGNTTEFQHYEAESLAGLRAVFREAARPTLGFCGGAQLLAQTFGSEVAAIDPAGTGSMDDESWRGRAHEAGFTVVRRLVEHPLLAGLGPEFVVMEQHYWEIKQLPAGFVNLARTEVTPIQCIAHQSLPLFGTQFHPERWDDAHPDGRTLLENFFNLINKG